MLVFLDECNWCGNLEERTFTDSWSGMELCLQCLSRVADYVTNSPSYDGDNLPIELMARAGDLRGWDEDDDEDEECWDEGSCCECGSTDHICQNCPVFQDGWSGPEPHADLLLSD